MTPTIKLAEIAAGRTPQTKEERRYETARDIFCAMIAATHADYRYAGRESLREWAVHEADALLAELEKEPK